MSVKRSKFTKDDEKFVREILEKDLNQHQDRIDEFSSALADRAASIRIEKDSAIKESRSPRLQEPNIRDLYSQIVLKDLGDSDVEPVGKNQTFRPPYDFSFAEPVSVNRSDKPAVPRGGAYVDHETGRLGGWSIASVEGADNSDFAFAIVRAHLLVIVDVEETGNLQVRINASPNVSAMGGVTRDEWGFSDVQVLQRFSVYGRILFFDSRVGRLRFIAVPGGEQLNRRDSSHWSLETRATVNSSFVPLGEVNEGDRLVIDLEGVLVNTLNCNDVTVSASTIQDWRVFEVGLRVV